MEVAVHQLLAERGLAAPLLAQFENGLLYKFIPGRVCTARDLSKEPVWRAVAATLGQWHAQLPVTIAAIENTSAKRTLDDQSDNGFAALSVSFPTIWNTLQKWTSALPTRTNDEKKRKVALQAELSRFERELYDQNPAGHKVSF